LEFGTTALQDGYLVGGAPHHIRVRLLTRYIDDCGLDYHPPTESRFAAWSTSHAS